MHFINRLTNATTTAQTAWTQQQIAQTAQHATEPTQTYIPPGTYPPGTQLHVGQHSITIESYLAEGGFAHVYLVRMDAMMEQVVLKRVAVADQDGLKSVNKEVAAMKQLNGHKNIVRYIDSQAGNMKGGGFEVLILMEFCSGGGVIDLMNRRLQNRLIESEILKIFSDVSEAVAHMHYCDPPLLHRDLKVENILITGNGSYKLSDFGSCTPLTGNNVPRSLQETQAVEEDIQRYTTMQYRAPEMVNVILKRAINEKADIWALGVLLYKLCYYTTPFEEQGQLAILNARYTIPQYPAFSHDIQRLIASMLKEDANHRPNIYQVMKTVSKMRGVECPIRNIYPDTLVSNTPSAPQLPSVIFETALPPPQPLPNIVPMRRGRPVRQEKGEAGSQAFQNSSISEFDPFDPFDPSRPANDAPGFSSNPTADLFSLNESTSFQSSLLNSNEFNNNGFVTGNSTSFAATSFNLPPNPSQIFSPPPPDVSQPTIGLNSSGSAPKRLLTGDNSGLSIDLSADSSAAMPLTGTFAAISLQADQQPSRATSPPSGTPSTSLTTNFFHFDAKRASTSALTPAHHHTFDQLTRTHSGGSNANPWQPQQFQSQPQPSLGQVSPPQPTPIRQSSAGSFASNSSTLSSSSNIPSPQQSQNHRAPSPRPMSPPSTKSSNSAQDMSPSTYQSRQYPISSQPPLVQPQPEQPLAQQQKPYKPVPPPKPVRFKLSTTSSTTSSTTVSPTVPVTKINQQNFGELTTPVVRTGTMTLPSSTTSMDAFLSKFPPAEALDAHVTQQIGGEMLTPRIGSATPGHSQTPPPSAPTRPLRPTRSYSDNQA